MVEYIDEDIKEVMDITGLDKTKSIKLFESVAKDIDDGTDDELCSYDVIDVIRIEHKVKENGADKMYQKSETKKPRKPKERKVDLEKKDLLSIVGKALDEELDIKCTLENEVKLHFNYKGSDYTLNLVKHRKPKK